VNIPSAADPVIRPGRPDPLGATWTGEGVNFAVFSAHADSIELCLFYGQSGREVSRFTLPGRTGNVWHGFLPDVGPGLEYGFRAHGKYAPRQGHRFNKHKLLIDPHARQLSGRYRSRPEVFGYAWGSDQEWRQDTRDSAPFVPRSVVVDDPSFDWSGDVRPRTPWERTVLYEMHVKGFTRLHPDVPPHLRGTYLGLAEPPVLQYLADLGVTAVELLPCQAFLSEDRLVEMGLTNYWGYNSIAFFAPHADYAFADPVREFKHMVRALHGVGIEVILDVVYNHTAEGGEGGPTLSFRGLDNLSYYRHVPEDLRYCLNYTGCGNTVDLSNPDVVRMVLDSLRYWVEEMHVDGFRFDLAVTLGRDDDGFRPNNPFLAALHQDPVLREVKLIAEPWDTGPDGYRLGRFPPPWSEWNDRFRDTARSFWRGDAGKVPEFAERMAGSSDLFRGTPGRQPFASVNFVTCHDGFTLQDALSFHHKRNEDNGEGNRDGHNDISWNCGVEGPTDDPVVERLRLKHRRNLLATLLLSQGVPMLLAGDEFGRSQQGNNNAYCQDNALSWVDWSEADRNQESVRFVRELIRLRLSHPVFRRVSFLDGQAHPESRQKDVTWLREDGREMGESDWRDPHRQSLGVLLDRTGVDLLRRDAAHADPGDSFLMLFNAGPVAVDFVVPSPVTSEIWEVVFDTREHTAAVPAHSFRQGTVYSLHRRSIALLADRG
jgi:glycogen operon protein